MYFNINTFIWLVSCLLFFSSPSGACSGYGSPEEKAKRVYSHLRIHDEQTALKECAQALVLYPTSDALKRAYIRVLIANQKENEAIAKWKAWGHGTINSDILEQLSWGVLHRFEHSHQLGMSIASLMGAFYTQDVRCIQMLKNCMCSSDPFLRAVAVKMTPHYRDTILIEQVKLLFEREKVWYVRLEAIQALGLMHVSGMKDSLKTTLTDTRSSLEEKMSAATAIVNLYDEIDPQEMSELVESNRADLRYLACQLIARLDLLSEIPRLLVLLDDPVPRVRMASLTTLYLLGLTHLSQDSLLKIQKMMDDSHPTLSITASWISMHFAGDKALRTLKKWVYSPHCDFRNLAAFAIGNSGVRGVSLAEEVMCISPDFFVKANIALGLMHQKIRTDLAGATLYQFLMDHQKKMMWQQTALFQILSPSLIQHVPHTSQYPTLIDQITRLDILNYLAILGYPKAKDAFKSFLKHQILGVSYAALTHFVREGGAEALSILRSFLGEKDQQLRVQAALVLALFCKDPRAIEILQDVYLSADRETKIIILEAIGHIGDQTSTPFLLEQLEKPHHMLKVMAASALVQCLYH